MVLRPYSEPCPFSSHLINKLPTSLIPFFFPLRRRGVKEFISDRNFAIRFLVFDICKHYKPFCMELYTEKAVDSKIITIICFTFHVCNVLDCYPFKIPGDTVVRFVSQRVITFVMSDGVEQEKRARLKAINNNSAIPLLWFIVNVRAISSLLHSLVYNNVIIFYIAKYACRTSFEHLA